jgi:cell shape-determining protein MreC
MSAQFYRPQREDRGRARLMYVTALLVIVLLLDLAAGGRLRSAVRLGVSQVYLSLVHSSEIIFGNQWFESRNKLLEENVRLTNQLNSYHVKDAAYDAMEEENTRLRTLLGLSSRLSGKAASVISSPSASAYGTFSIDVGINEGVARGAVVYSPDGYAVGVVTETDSSTSLVTQLFAPNASLESVVDDTLIVLEGQGGGNARARAPRESTVKVGSVVRAPSVDAPVGIVQHIESSPTGVDQQLYVRIPANLQTLTLVYVSGK